MAGLLPIMWSSGTGSEVMSRIAAPMIGGMISSTVLTLVVIPVVYDLLDRRADEHYLARARRAKLQDAPSGDTGTASIGDQPA